MSEKRKKALIVYLAGLFVAAFLFVGISLWSQSLKGPITTSADRVMQLQSQIQELEATIHEMELNMTNMENEMVEIGESYDFILKNTQNAASQINYLEIQLTAYQYLTQLQQAYHLNDQAEAARLIELLAPMSEHLEENDLIIYQTISDYAQEPPAE